MRHSTARPPLGRRAGFTLVELLIVTMLLGIMAGVAAPRYQRALDDAALRAATKRLAADLRSAQQRARLRATTVGIEFVSETGVYHARTNGPDALPDPDRPERPLSVSLDKRVAIETAEFGPDGWVDFDFRGDPSRDGFVRLRNSRRTTLVTVNALGNVVVTL